MGLYGREIAYEPEELKAAGLGFTNDFTFLGLIGMKNLWDLVDLWIFFFFSGYKCQQISYKNPQEEKKILSLSVFAKNYFLTRILARKRASK